MYIYLDQHGFVKEIVNDKALRQANDNINHIYLYVENFSPLTYTSISATYKLPNDSVVGPQSIDIGSVVRKTIPYSKIRDLKFFKDYQEYDFFDIAIPDGSDPTLGNVLAETGLVKTTISFLNGSNIFALQTIPFYVEESVVRQSYNINSDQYNYLLQLLQYDWIIPNIGGTLDDTLSSIRIKGVNYGVAGGSGGGEPDAYIKTITATADPSLNYPTYEVKGKNYTSAVDFTIKARPINYTRYVKVNVKELSICNVVNDTETISGYGVMTTGLALNSDLTAEINRAKGAENTKVDKQIIDSTNNSINRVINEQGNEGVSLYGETAGTSPKLVAITTNTTPGSTDGLLAEIYAIDKTTKKGTRIIVKENKIYYTKNKADYSVEDSNEIATKADVGSIGSDYIKLLGNEAGSGQPYHFPFNILDLRFDTASNKIKGTLDTITLDNSKTNLQYPLEVEIPLATTTNDGLLSKNDKGLIAKISDKQDASNNTSLKTTDKSIVGAINENYDAIATLEGDVTIKVVTSLPTTLEKNTLYFVGPDSNNHYHRYLVDSAGTSHDLGTTELDLTDYVKTTTFTTELGKKQNTITATNPLGSSLISWETKAEEDAIKSGITADLVAKVGAMETGKLNVLPKATATEPYHIPFNFRPIVYGEDSISCVFDTITLDNALTKKDYTITLNTATATTAGLMSKGDKVKLNSLDASLFQTIANLDKTVPTSPSENKYLSTKAILEEIAKKEDKLPTYIANTYLMAYEDTTTGTVKLKWDIVGRSSSEVGDIIANSKYDTMGKVTARYGGTYWALINHDTDYYQWERTDKEPTYYVCKGMRIFGTLIINQEAIDTLGYQDADYKLLSNVNGNYQWTVESFVGHVQKVLPAYIGMYVANDQINSVAEINAIYGGQWEQWDGGGADEVHQYHCIGHDALTNKIVCNIGEIIINTNCDTAAKLLDYYIAPDGTQTGLKFGSDDGEGVPMATYTEGGVTVYQWRCLAA